MGDLCVRVLVGTCIYIMYIHVRSRTLLEIEKGNCIYIYMCVCVCVSRKEIHKM